MAYRIVVDSCCELPDQYYTDERFIRIPLELQIGDYRIPDDDDFNQLDFIRRVAESAECARSACPPPEKFMQAYSSDVSDIYVVTLSAKLSGSYNAAVLAADLYEEEYEDEYGPRNIHVFDSQSASAGESQIALKILECAEAGHTFEEIVDMVENFRDIMKTYFVIDNLDTFIKNGRVSKLKGTVASTLNIKPILTGVDGEIEQIGQAMGMKKAINSLIDAVKTRHPDATGRKLIITHCNCPERAQKIADALEELTGESAIIMPTRGVSTMYANDGGVVVTI